MTPSHSLPFDAPYQPIPLGPDQADDDVEDRQPKFIADRDGLVDFKVKWIHLLLGCTLLLPWNVMITAMPYFFKRVAGSSIEHTLGSYLSISCTASNFIFLAHATVTSKHASPSRRARGAIISIGFLTCLLVVSTFFVMPPRLFFCFILLNAAAQSAAGSYLQTAVVAVASLFGPAAMQAVMAGQAVIAVAVSGVQVVSAIASTWGKARTSTSDRTPEEGSAFFFFTLSTLFVFASAIAHNWLVNSSTYKAVAAPLEQRAIKRLPSSMDSSPEPLLPRGKNEADDDWRQAVRLAKANITYEIAVAYIFVITLAVFPPITASILPVNPETHPLLFTSVHFLVFNIGDLLGRYSCSFPIFLIWSRKRLLVLSLARTLFIPLFLMCNVQRPSTMMASPPIINSDFMFMLILILCGWSNGYLSSLCMMSAPSVEHNPVLKGKREDVDVAATVANFCLVGGLVLGSAASFAVKSAICQCNPFTA